MKLVSVAGRDILLARVGDKYYAAQNRCPHMSGNLSQGKLEGTIVTCPNHSSQFDLTDGHVVRWTNFKGIVLAASKLVRPPRPLPIYPTKIEGEKVLVEI
jgi:3-phenylpropionate/trans-cinnamate dioxygenase ferredoxin subunit